MGECGAAGGRCGRSSSLVDHVMHDHAYRAPPPGLPPTTDGFDDPYATNYDEYGNNLGASVQDPNWCGPPSTRRTDIGDARAQMGGLGGAGDRRTGAGAHREVGDGIRPMRGPSAGLVELRVGSNDGLDSPLPTPHLAQPKKKEKKGLFGKKKKEKVV